MQILRDGQIRNVLLTKPRSIASYELMKAIQLDCGENIETIIDAGANVGQFAKASKQAYPRASIFSIEPNNSLIRELKQNLLPYSKVTVIEAALGEEPTNVSFYPNSYSQASSLLHLTEQGSESASFRELTPETVRMITLDCLFTDYEMEQPILLKLDLQGYELKALQGASCLLESTSFVVCEIAFRTFYEGQPTFDDLNNFFKKNGFKFSRPLNIVRNANGGLDQMDALFCR